MLAPEELKKIRIFSGLDEEDIHWLSSQAADLHLQAGEYLIHEGEPTSFFVLIEGVAEAIKDSMGRRTEVSHHYSGDFFGELPILVATSAAPASVRAETSCRFARLDPQGLQELIRRSPACSAAIMQTLNERIQIAQNYMLGLPSSRVQIVGSKFDDNCRDIRTFLSTNRIPYHWIDSDRISECSLPAPSDEQAGSSVIVDDSTQVTHPLTVRKVAEALGFQTVPKRDQYDTLIIGGGPAGLAAAVYGASEGLSVLLVERNAPGGQAGTSSRIENYLGFPNGISGDDLSQRAFKQALKFGAEVVLTREVRQVLPAATGRGYTVALDEGEIVHATTVILATGVDWRKISAEGIDRFIGRGVVYGGAKADAQTVVGKRIFIVGGGNSAGQTALFFSGYASSVTILIRGTDLKHSMSQYLVDQIGSATAIQVETEAEVVSVSGRTFLEMVSTRKKGQPALHRPAEALFVMIGADAATEWLPPQLQRKNGYICTGNEVTDLAFWVDDRAPYLLETNLSGLFCVGDVRYKSIKRVSSSVGEGSMAIAFIHQYLANVSSTP